MTDLIHRLETEPPSRERMTPTTMQVLLHFYYSPMPYPCNGEAWYTTAEEWLLDRRLIQLHKGDHHPPGRSRWTITERGRALVEHILHTPLPECHWIVPSLRAREAT